MPAVAASIVQASAALLSTGGLDAQAGPDPKRFTQQQFEAASAEGKITLMLDAAADPSLWTGPPPRRADIAYAIAVPGDDSWHWRVELRGKGGIRAGGAVCERRLATLEPYPVPRAGQPAGSPTTTPLMIYRVWQRRTFAAAAPRSAPRSCPDEATGRYVPAPDPAIAAVVFAAVAKLTASLEKRQLPLEFGCTEPHGWDRCRDAPARLGELLVRYSRIDTVPPLAARAEWRRYVIADEGWSAIISVHGDQVAGAALEWRQPPVL